MKEQGATSHISQETTSAVNQEVATFTEQTVDNDVVLMKLAIEIETTMRAIAVAAGMQNTRVPLGQLIQMLRNKEILTDRWLLNALAFFQTHRNELIHEGRTEHIRSAIDIGREILAHLRDIQQRQRT